MDKQQRTALLLMALTVLIDITGFGLIIPLIPFWAQHFGADPFAIGLLTSLYALAQFIFTPILGSLSDRYGRKPIIIVSLIIEALSFVLTALAGSLPMLMLARFVGGLGASNIGSAQAFVADVTPREKRAQGMGMIGAAIGLGFVIGPALGGLLAAKNQGLPFWIAAAVAIVNALLVLAFLPESRALRPTQPSHKPQRGLGVLFSGWGTATRYPAVLILILVNLIYTIAFTGMENVFPLFTQHYFQWGATQNAYIFTYIGVIIVIMQGGLVNRLVKRWQERGVMLGGLVLMAVGLIALAFSTQLSWLLITLGILSIGDGAISPTVSALLSFASPGESQGELLGLSQGFAGLARIIGPLIAGAIYKISSAGMPFIVGGILVVLAALIAAPMLSHVQKPASSATPNVAESSSSIHD